MYQKTISALLCLALLLGLAGCGAQEAQTTISTEQNIASATVETQETLGTAPTAQTQEPQTDDFDVSDAAEDKTDFSKYEVQVQTVAQNGDTVTAEQETDEQTVQPGTGDSSPQHEEQPDSTQGTCYFTISCEEILDNMDLLTPGCEAFVPENGLILETSEVPFEKGESVFDVLKKVTRECGIQMEFSYFPMYESMYIEGINNLYEKNCGGNSGWLYYVNGVKPNYGVSKYILEDQDVVEFHYTCG